jgi:uncharacterized membrane protein YdbT with pleckstrin-like domain
MTLNPRGDEKVVWTGRRSWRAAFLTWSAVVTVGLWALVLRYGTKYIITTERAYSRHGLIGRRETFVNLEEVREVGMNQSAVQRLIGEGTVTFATAGTGTPEVVFSGVANPTTVREQIPEKGVERSRD